jgi:hypothetical protein
MGTVKFRGEILIRGVNPYVLVSRKQADQIKTAWRKPLPVLVRVNGQPNEQWRINMMPVGDGNFYLYLHSDVRKASNTKVGDIVSIEISFDAAYRNGPQPVPEWFAKALIDHPIAKNNWEKLSPSRQKEIVRYLMNLKSSEAQARNVIRAIGVLSGEHEQFMGRLWHDGS